MNLTVGELAELPLPAALFDGDDMVIAHTPEWRAAVPGDVVYRIRRTRLVVSTGDGDPMCEPILERLLAEIDGAAAALPRRQALRVSMLAASLRVVAGRGVTTSGTSADVLESACAGIASRTALQVSIEGDAAFAVLAPQVAALVLVQLAANAERHDHADSVALRAARHCFTVEWRGSRGASRVTAARRRAERARWGLGFTRLAADSIGGVLYPPTLGGDGVRSASLEVGLNRLSLPLTLVHEGRVRKATRTWEEETALSPGETVPFDGHAGRCAAAAACTPGAIARVDGWSARTGRDGTWVAIPPDAAVDRARDVLDGMVHERALWDGVPDPAWSRIVALAAILASLLGADIIRVPGATWNRLAPALARTYGLMLPVPRFAGPGAVDPRVALFVAAECGIALHAVGDDLYLRVRRDRLDDPLVRVFPTAADGLLKLS